MLAARHQEEIPPHPFSSKIQSVSYSDSLSPTYKAPFSICMRHSVLSIRTTAAGTLMLTVAPPQVLSGHGGAVWNWKMDFICSFTLLGSKFESKQASANHTSVPVLFWRLTSRFGVYVPACNRGAVDRRAWEILCSSYWSFLEEYCWFMMKLWPIWHPSDHVILGICPRWRLRLINQSECSIIPSSVFDCLIFCLPIKPKKTTVCL